VEINEVKHKLRWSRI